MEEAKAGRVELGLLARQPDEIAEESVASLKLQAVGAVGVAAVVRVPERKRR